MTLDDQIYISLVKTSRRIEHFFSHRTACLLCPLQLFLLYNIHRLFSLYITYSREEDKIQMMK